MFKCSVTAVAVAVACLAVGSYAGAATIYSQDFNNSSTAAGSVDGIYEYFGPSPQTVQAFGVDANGVGGSQGFYDSIDASGDAGVTYYFYAGLGRSDIAAPGTLVGTTASNVTFSVDLAAVGNISATPVSIQLAQFNGNTATYTNAYSPTLTAGFNHLSYALGSVGTTSGTYDPTRNLSLVFTYDNNGFGLDAGNFVRIDNLLLTTAATPEPAAMAVLGVAGTAALRRRRA